MVYQAPLEDQLRDDTLRVHECKVRDDFELTIDEEINTQSINYNRSKGEQMAINTDGDKNLEDMMFPKRLMDKRMLISKTNPNQNIAVGIIQDGELHLTPAVGAATLRPTFRYLDTRAKQEGKEKQEDGSEDEEEMKQVTVKFARRPSDHSKKIKENFLTKPDDERRWKPADYYDPSSSLAEITTSKLFCSKPGDLVNELPDRKKQLLNALKPELDSHSHGLPLTQLGSLPLIDRVRTILTQVRVIDLATIHRLLGAPAGPSDVQDRIRVVQHVAVLVQGCWVIQSDVAIAKDTTPNGVPAVLARFARDYMVTKKKLLELNKNFFPALPVYEKSLCI